MGYLIQNGIAYNKFIQDGVEYGGQGGSPVEYFLENGLVTTGTISQYITVPLDKPIPVGTPLCISLYDAHPTYPNDAPIQTCVAYFNGGTLYAGESQQWYPGSNDSYILAITSTTAGITSYRGVWRDIYAKISRLQIQDGQIYKEE